MLHRYLVDSVAFVTTKLAKRQLLYLAVGRFIIRMKLWCFHGWITFKLLGFDCTELAIPDRGVGIYRVLSLSGTFSSSDFFKKRKSVNCCVWCCAFISLDTFG